MTRHRLVSVLVIFAAAAILLLPALWNGFPLLYWDSVDYMDMPFTGVIKPFRTASYVLVMLPGVLTGTLWAPLVFQALLIAFVLHETLDAFAPGRPTRSLLPVTAGLTLASSLPWVASQLMADAFTGVVVLGLATLAFGPQRPLWRRGVLAAVVALGIAVHTSHLAVAAGLLLVMGALTLAVWRWRERFGWLALRPRLPALAVAGGVLLAGIANWGVSGHFFVMQSNAHLMFARLLQDGIGHRYLADVCPTPAGAKLKLCKVRDRLPHNANAYLWSPGPFYDLGGWKNADFQKEAAFVVNDSVRRYPLQHLKTAIGLAWQQLWMLDSGDGLIGLDTIHKREHTTVKSMFMPRYIADYYPDDLPAYWDSEQRYGIDMSPFQPLHHTLAILGMLGLVAAGVMAWRERDGRRAGLMLMVSLALLGNAFVCGALSNPLDRYQARLVWVAVLASGIAVARYAASAAEARSGDAATARPALGSATMAGEGAAL